MWRLRLAGPSLAVSAALTIGLLFAELAAGNGGYATGETVYAIDLTPTPSATPYAFGRQLPPTSTVIPTGATAPATATVIPTGAAALPPTVVQPLVPAPASSNPGMSPGSASQQASDQIAAVSQQVTQAVQDPSLSIDAKVERINNLVVQFNQLVGQWQQQVAQNSSTSGAAAPPVCGVGCAQQTPPSVAGVQATPSTTRTPTTTTVPTATPSPSGSSPTGNPTADELRAQITSLSQQMAEVSQDPSLSTAEKTAQLSSLGAQFDRLVKQLQQLGG